MSLQLNKETLIGIWCAIQLNSTTAIEVEGNGVLMLGSCRISEKHGWSNDLSWCKMHSE